MCDHVMGFFPADRYFVNLFSGGSVKCSSLKQGRIIIMLFHGSYVREIQCDCGIRCNDHE
jgi:hypothetical protein